MKSNTAHSFRVLTPLIMAAGLAIVSASAAAGPTNSWAEWQYKKLVCGFTNSLLVSMNGHALPPFATNLFGEHAHMFIYCDVDGWVFGAGDITLQSSDRQAVFNVEARGSLKTKGSRPSLSFTLTGEGSGSVGLVPGTAQLNAKFVQTRFITNAPGGSLPETYYAEGKISGTVKQKGGTALKFEDTIRLLLDNVPGHYGDIGGGPQLRLDLVDIDGHRFAGHTHGTNNCFGRYEDDRDELLATGTYEKKSGGLNFKFRGLGHSAAIKGTVTAKLDSASPGALIHVGDVTLKARAFGQKTTWNGNGLVYEIAP